MSTTATTTSQQQNNEGYTCKSNFDFSPLPVSSYKLGNIFEIVKTVKQDDTTLKCMCHL